MERKPTAILSADVESYSRLMGEDEEATIRTLTSYRQVMTVLIPLHRGRVVDAVKCAAVSHPRRWTRSFASTGKTSVPTTRWPETTNQSYRVRHS